MGKLNLQQATYREQRFTVAPKTEYVMSFYSGDMPNMFYVRNESKYTAYVSLTKMPTPTNFEFKISGHSSDVVGRPSTTSRLYIYNDSDEDINIYVISVNDIFNLDYLKNLKIYLDSDVADQIKFDGIIKGFEGASLPPGTNNIGKVDVNNWSDVQSIGNDLNTLLSDNIDIKSKLDILIADVKHVKHDMLFGVLKSDAQSIIAGNTANIPTIPAGSHVSFIKSFTWSGTNTDSLQVEITDQDSHTEVITLAYGDILTNIETYGKTIVVQSNGNLDFNFAIIYYVKSDSYA